MDRPKTVRPTLLTVEDDESYVHLFRRVFPEDECDLLTAESSEKGLELISASTPDAVLVDVNLPDGSGVDFFRKMHEVDSRIPAVFLTGSGNTETAIEAMKLGAFDYLLKPVDPLELSEVVRRAFETSRLMKVPATIAEYQEPGQTGDLLIGRCGDMQQVYKAIGRVAPQEVTVLILGESGTGKELIARAIYQHSQRSQGPFLAINCAAIAESLFESELFGHEKGSFTNAHQRRIGKFEQYSGGTIFLDEVGEMSPMMQSKMLRLLQDQQFERVGGNETIQTDVRLIAATNKNLEELSAQGQFRTDLYYRLSGFTIKLPALCDRGNDIELLIRHFVDRTCAELGKSVNQIAPDALLTLKRHPWPGNVRELQSVLRQAIILAPGPVLTRDCLPPELAVNSTDQQTHSENTQPAAKSPTAAMDFERFVLDRIQTGTTDLYAECLSEFDRIVLNTTLEITEGNQAKAARYLGITRGTLRTKLRSLGISVEKKSLRN